MKTVTRADVPRPVSEDLDQRDLAIRRLGATPTAQLRWVVHDFARRALALTRPEELIALGYDLRALAAPPGTLTRSRHAPLPVAAIKRIHADVNTGLQRLLSNESADLTKGGWEYPPPTRVRIVRLGGVFLRVQDSQDEVASILAAIGELIVRAGSTDLRACRECHLPFVRTGRRRFCDERCSMRVRNRNRPKKKKGTTR
jgi:hypothetical protein